jgi:Flp pilus assembly protein TadB
MGFMEALLLAFIILKLTGVIAWPWFLVLAPLYPDIILYLILAPWIIRKVRKHRADVKKFDEEFERMDWPKF